MAKWRLFNNLHSTSKQRPCSLLSSIRLHLSNIESTLNSCISNDVCTRSIIPDWNYVQLLMSMWRISRNPWINVGLVSIKYRQYNKLISTLKHRPLTNVNAASFKQRRIEAEKVSIKWRLYNNRYSTLKQSVFTDVNATSFNQRWINVVLASRDSQICE